jgi:hypothetical protein
MNSGIQINRKIKYEIAKINFGLNKFKIVHVDESLNVFKRMNEYNFYCKYLKDI